MISGLNVHSQDETKIFRGINKFNSDQEHLLIGWLQFPNDSW
jgi:hypothetical protein